MAAKVEAKKEASPDDIMGVSDMEPILATAKRGNPVFCAMALTKDKEGVLLVDKKIKPKRLAANLKKQAAEVGLELDTTTIRFGKAVVSDEDTSLLTLAVNKNPPSAMRPKLLERMKRAGFSKLDVTIESALEDEPEEDEKSGANSDAVAKEAAALENFAKVWEAAEAKLRREFQSVEKEIADLYAGDSNASKAMALHKAHSEQVFKTLDGTLPKQLAKSKSCKTPKQLAQIKKEIRATVASHHKFLSSDKSVDYLRGHPLGEIDVDAMFSPVLAKATSLVK